MLNPRFQFVKVEKTKRKIVNYKKFVDKGKILHI